MLKKYLIILILLFLQTAYADTKLYIKTVPENGKVKILNIKQKYKYGLNLKKGTYRISIKLKNYATKRFNIKIDRKKKLNLKIRLLPLRFINSIGMEFVYIEPGTFMMGSPPNEPGRVDQEPRFIVSLTEGFYIQTTEVSEGQYKKLMGRNPSDYPMGDKYPVENVSWDDANKFINKLINVEKGGCNPAPLERNEVNGMVVINTSSINAGLRYF